MAKFNSAKLQLLLHQPNTFLQVFTHPTFLAKQFYYIFHRNEEYSILLLNNIKTWEPVIKVTFLFSLWICHAACGILALWPGIEPGPMAVKALSLNHWRASAAFLQSSMTNASHWQHSEWALVSGFPFQNGDARISLLYYNSSHSFKYTM